MPRTVAALVRDYFDGKWDSCSSDFLSEALRQSDSIPELKGVLTNCLGDPDLSIPILNRLIELDPGDFESILSLGWVYWSTGDEKSSGNILLIAEELNPNAAEVMELRNALSLGSSSNSSS
jgi:tetratricopeptide (TPR) repeat protein